MKQQDIVDESIKDIQVVLDSLVENRIIKLGSMEHQLLLRVYINLTFETRHAGSWPATTKGKVDGEA
jgi:hypothetical protein